MKFTTMSCARALVISLMASSAFTPIAHAQETGAPTRVEEQQSGAIGDIVVTARRRSELAQDVPVSITALSGEGLTDRGIQKIDDLKFAAPALNTTPLSSRRSVAAYELRGIGTSALSLPQDPTVGFYVNEVAQARPHGTNQSLFDIETVQVLYGPQGTLFGRNTTAGAILISTRRPEFKTDFDITLNAGNLQRRDITAIVNVPITDTLAVRAGVKRSHRDGYVTNLTDGSDLADQDAWSWRASVLFKPTDAFENLLIYDGYRARENGSPNMITADTQVCGTSQTYERVGGGTVTIPVNPSICNNAALRSRLTAAFQQQQTLGRKQLRAAPGSFEDVDVHGFANISTLNLSDAITAKNIFGYRDIKSNTLTDFDGTTIDMVNTYSLTDVDQISNELQLQGKADGFNWIVGGFYFREKGRDFALSRTQEGALTTTDSVSTSISKSVFAQATYRPQFLEGFGITAGARYTWDTRRGLFQHMNVQPNGSFVLDPSLYNYTCRNAGQWESASAAAPLDVKRASCALNREANFSDPTYTLTIDYRIAPRVLVYAAHRRGYRSGGFSLRGGQAGAYGTTPPSASATAVALAGLTPFLPEKVLDVEAGIKADFSLGSMPVRTNLAVYKIWYDNIQRSNQTVVPGTNPPALATIIGNAAKAEIKGFELSVTVIPIPDFQINASWGHVDASHKEFGYNSAATGPVVLANIPFGQPKNSVSANLSYTPDLGDAGRLNASISYSYKDPFFHTTVLPRVDPFSRTDSIELVNARLGLTNAFGSNADVSLYMNNLFDTKYQNGCGAYQLTIGFTACLVGEPRTYGVELRWKMR
ncbi:iron complex outermembrane recepter protein [Sphingobium faniae]|nr:iron complex outermembrane recepter protein [Sphingobium faniae]